MAHHPLRRKNGAELIRDERFRQVVDESWSSQHDDHHTGGELELAAECYLRFGNDERFPALLPPPEWPWEPKWWKPDILHTRNLVKAGALIAAEIDRLARVPIDT